VSLNAQQRAAVRYLDGPLLVLAGAGSGKTRLITHKIVHLIKTCGIAPQHIAAVTFTNKAAREMQIRVASLMGGKKAQGLRVSTFHSLGLNILRRETAALGYRPNFSILDADDCSGLIRDLLRREFSDDSQVKAVYWQISAWKNAMVDAEQALALADGDAVKTLAAGLYGQYQRHLKSYNAVDFDDLIFLPVRLFADHPGGCYLHQVLINFEGCGNHTGTGLCCLDTHLSCTCIGNTTIYKDCLGLPQPDPFQVKKYRRRLHTACCENRSSNRGFLTKYQPQIQPVFFPDTRGDSRICKTFNDHGFRLLNKVKMKFRGYWRRPQHFLYFFPLPQGQGSLRPIFSPSLFMGCC